MDAEGDQPGHVAQEALVVVGFDETSEGCAELEDLVDIARSTLMGEGWHQGRMDLIAVDESKIAELNEAHMGQPGPTDVLSFPLDAADGLSLDSADVTEMDRHLGDVVFCPSVAERQAPEHCGSRSGELALLVIHGTLHLIGHDHEEPGDQVRMVACERKYLEALGHRHPGPQAPKEPDSLESGSLELDSSAGDQR